MLEKLKANILFNKLFGRPDISIAYKKVPPSDSWYNTINTVHQSLAEIITYPRELVEIKSYDNLSLKGYYYPAQEKSEVTVIWVHGYTSHAERESAFPSLFYKSLGFNVLIPDLRAHDVSQGKYIAFGGAEVFDLERWVDKVNEIHPEGKIIIHGLSMGGCIAILSSAVKMKNVRCIISDAPSVGVCHILREITKDTFKKNGEKVYAYCIEKYEKEFGYNPEEYNVFDKIKISNYPILLSAGSMENLDELFEQLTKLNPQPTDSVILPGCNHGNGMYKQTELYQGKIKEFLSLYL